MMAEAHKIREILSKYGSVPEDNEPMDTAYQKLLATIEIMDSQIINLKDKLADKEQVIELLKQERNPNEALS